MQAAFTLRHLTHAHAARDAHPVTRLHRIDLRPGGFRRAEDAQFAAMFRAFEVRGGLVPGDAVARRLRRHVDQPISRLAQLIVSRSIVSLSRHAEILVPMFQFSEGTMMVRPVVQRVLVELNDVFDDWEVALWFASPNIWLRNSSPLELLDNDADRVAEAARADRFVAHG